MAASGKLVAAEQEPRTRANRQGRERILLLGGPADVPAQAPPEQALAPRGAPLDGAMPPFGFELRRKDEVWAENVFDLYEQAKRQQWNASEDLAWDAIPALDDELERAVCQVMSFLVQAEYVALHLPAKFIPRIDPTYTEVALFLATQVVDEARHIEVFTRRALARGGGLQTVSAATQWSLKSLLAQEDYTSASFLMHVLGEGSFLDLFKVLEELAPDPVTAEMLRWARLDESRHVAYGVARGAQQIASDPEAANRMIAAAEARASFVRASAGADPALQEALAVLAGGGSSPEQLERGRARLAGLQDRLHVTRVNRLRRMGFSEEQAEHLSRLHGTAVKSFM
ncbi:MAG: DUF455 domain-containing protein [Gaiellaceae bacterium]